jgi:hypothetical protein
MSISAYLIIATRTFTRTFFMLFCGQTCLNQDSFVGCNYGKLELDE